MNSSEEDGSESDSAVEVEADGCSDGEIEALSATQRVFTFPGILTPIVLKQDLMGIDGTGGAVWRASEVLAQWCCNDTSTRERIKGGKILEVGSGLGLVAITASRLGARRVVATDVDEVPGNGLLALLEINISANCASSGGTRPIVVSLWWGELPMEKEVIRQAFDGLAADVVLVCDVLAWPELYPLLAKTLRAACPATGGGVLILCHQYRSRLAEDEFINSFKDDYTVACVHSIAGKDGRQVKIAIFEIRPQRLATG